MASDLTPAAVPVARRIATLALFVAALAMLLSLGTWQMQRLQWKNRLLADIAERRNAPAVPLADIEKLAAGGADIDYRAVTLSGTFYHAAERHFFATFEGATGFYVYTPLTLDDGRSLLVNRGFVPYDMKDAKTRPPGQVEGRVTIDGLSRARLSQKPSSLVPDNDLVKNIFYWKDLDTMAASAGIDPQRLLPFFVDAGPQANPGGWPRGGVTMFGFANNHLQYALTWYGLAGALVIVAGFAYFRQTGKAAPPGCGPRELQETE